MYYTSDYKHAFWNVMRGKNLSAEGMNEGRDASTDSFSLPVEDFSAALEKDNLFRRYGTVITLSAPEGTI